MPCHTGTIPLFAVDIAGPLFDYSLGWFSPPVVPLAGGGAIILRLFLIVCSLLFIRSIHGLWISLGRTLVLVPPGMVPLPALVPATAIIPLSAPFAGCMVTLPVLGR